MGTGVIPFILTSLDESTQKRYSTIHINNNSINAVPALGVTYGTGGWIKNNRIAGDVLLFYSENFNELNWEISVENRRKAEGNILKINPFASKHTLYIHGNNLLRIRTHNSGIKIPEISETVKALSYSNLVVSENIFSGGQSSFIASSISLVNNHFNKNESDVSAYLLGFLGIITGNIIQQPSIRIETLFALGRKITEPNLGSVV